MSDKKYNGWSSYETWLVNLWLGNDQETYLHLKDSIATIKHTKDADQQDIVIMCADFIADFVNEIAFEQPLEGLKGDLLNSAIANVNYIELANHWLEE